MKANPTTDRLAVRPREAAELLDISPRTLWNRTAAGEIRVIRVGESGRGNPVIYPLAALPLDEPATTEATPDREFYIGEAARLLSVSPDTVWRLVESKQIPFTRPGGDRGPIYFRLDELRRWLAETPGT